MEGILGELDGEEVNACPYLARIAELLQRHSLDAILVGNAGAAIQGAP